MTFNDIAQARSSYLAKHGKLPTKLNICESDAVKLLAGMIGRGSLPADLQDKAIEASQSKELTLKFFKHSEIFGMKVSIIRIVE